MRSSYIKRRCFAFLTAFLFCLLAMADSETLYAGQSTTLMAPSAPRGFAYQTKWTCSNSNISFEREGRYSAQIRVDEYFSGSATVVCRVYYEWYESTNRYEGMEMEQYIISCKAVDIDLSQSSMELKVDESQRLYANLWPSIDPTPSVTWRSGNTSVARVSGGTVTGVGSGSTYIYAKSNAGPDEARCYVTVKDVKPTKVTLPSTSSAYVGEDLTLTPTLAPSDARATFTWYNSNASVASITGGKLAGKDEGKTVVYCISDNGIRSNDCEVTVKYRVATGVTLSATSLSVPIGQSRSLSWTPVPANARTSVTWASANEDVATVSSSGTVRGVSAGTTRITATTDNGKTATCTVTVPPDPVSASLPNAISLYRGNSRQLVCTIEPVDAYRTITWQSSDPAVATVTSDGSVTSLYPGTAVITATTHNGKKATCRVDVPEPDFNFYVWLTSGEKVILALVEKPSVTYEAGKLRVTTSNRIYEYPAEEVVRFSMQDDMKNEAPTSISVTPSLSLNYRDYAQLECQLYPVEYDIDTEVTWTTSDRYVAQVDANGRVYANLPGECTITATTSNGRKATSRISVAHHDFYLIVWKPAGEQVAFLLTEHPSVSQKGGNLCVETSSAAIELPLEGISRFTLADRLPEGQMVNAPYYDMNHDGRISVIDVALIISRMGESTSTYQIKEAVDAVLRKK